MDLLHKFLASLEIKQEIKDFYETKISKAMPKILEFLKHQ